MSATSSTVARWRPAVLALTVASAGLAVWYLHKSSTLWAGDDARASGLHRSNAIRRRSRESRPRRRRRLSYERDLQALHGMPAVDAQRMREEFERFCEVVTDTYTAADASGGLVEFRVWDMKRMYEILDECDRVNPQGRQDSQEVAEHFEERVLRRLRPDHNTLRSERPPEEWPIWALMRDDGGLDAFVKVFMDHGFRQSHVVEATLIGFNIDALLNTNETTRQYVLDYNLEHWSAVVGNSVEVTDRHRQMFQWVAQRSPSPTREVPAEAMGTFLEGLHEAEVTELDGTDAADHGDNDSEMSWEFERDGDETDAAKKDAQSLLNILYHIAEDQSRRDGYVHRGVSCNSCNVMPIRGIRYRCSNCPDFDLCEQCEAMQTHPRTHLMYKIRIPAPFINDSQPGQSPRYPGRMGNVLTHLPRDVSRQLSQETGRDMAEIEALWDTFKCLANAEWPEDPLGFGVAVDQDCFDRCFLPTTKVVQRPPALPLHDRLFQFFDTNKDQRIGFKEFVLGIASIRTKDRATSIRRCFWMYDFNDDGYIDRKDFLLMFRSYFTLQKDLTMDMLQSMSEDVLEGTSLRDALQSSAPISSIFSAPIPTVSQRRNTDGKAVGDDGERTVTDGGDVLAKHDHAEAGYYAIVADAREQEVFSNVCHINKVRNFIDDGDESHHLVNSSWPPLFISESDAAPFLPPSFEQPTLYQITDRSTRVKIIKKAIKDRQKVREEAIKSRFQRRDFYDPAEEPSPSYSHANGGISASFPAQGEDIGGPLPPTDSVPPMRYQDAGQEYLFEMLQESLNEMIDPLFRISEDLALLAERTEPQREPIRDQLQAYGTEKMRVLCREQILDPDLFTRSIVESRGSGGAAELNVEQELRKIVERQHNPVEGEYISNLTHMAAVGVIESAEYQRRANALAEREDLAQAPAKYHLRPEGEAVVREAKSALAETAEPAEARSERLLRAIEEAVGNVEASPEASEANRTEGDHQNVEAILASLSAHARGAMGNGHATQPREGQRDSSHSGNPHVIYENEEPVNAGISEAPAVPVENTDPVLEATKAVEDQLQAATASFEDPYSAIKAVEELLSSSSFDALLAASGYGVVNDNDEDGDEDTSGDEWNKDAAFVDKQQQQQQQLPPLPQSTKQRLDPTMPQNKPNSSHPDEPPAKPSKPDADTTAEAEGDISPTTSEPKGKEKMDKSANSDATATPTANASSPPAPTDVDLKYHLMLDCLQQVNKERGGPGRLSLPEFQKTHNGIHARRLEFHSTFFELITF